MRVEHVIALTDAITEKKALDAKLQVLHAQLLDCQCAQGKISTAKLIWLRHRKAIAKGVIAAAVVALLIGGGIYLYSEHKKALKAKDKKMKDKEASNSRLHADLRTKTDELKAVQEDFKALQGHVDAANKDYEKAHQDWQQAQSDLKDAQDTSSRGWVHSYNVRQDYESKLADAEQRVKDAEHKFKEAESIYKVLALKNQELQLENNHHEDSVLRQCKNVVKHKKTAAERGREVKSLMSENARLRAQLDEVLSLAQPDSKAPSTPPRELKKVNPPGGSPG